MMTQGTMQYSDLDTFEAEYRGIFNLLGNFINKFYLSKIFRETYGTTVNNVNDRT